MVTELSYYTDPFRVMCCHMHVKYNLFCKLNGDNLYAVYYSFNRKRYVVLLCHSNTVVILCSWRTHWNIKYFKGTIWKTGLTFFIEHTKLHYRINILCVLCTILQLPFFSVLLNYWLCFFKRQIVDRVFPNLVVISTLYIVRMLVLELQWYVCLKWYDWIELGIKVTIKCKCFLQCFRDVRM
jgi:hypothetical protein